MKIHETAVVEQGVHIGQNVSIGPYSHIKSGAVVGEGSVLESHAMVRGGVVLGRDVYLDSFAVVGGAAQEVGLPQDHPGRVAIGTGVVMREGATVHRSTDTGSATSIGRDTLLMAYSHVAHDCHIGANVVLSNNVLVGGHVEIGDFAVLGGGVGIHQHCRIGEGAMISGHAGISRDVPPFTLVSGRDVAHGLNTVGLRRRGVTSDVIAELKRCFRQVLLAAGDPVVNALNMLEANKQPSEEVSRFLTFFVAGGRGFCRSVGRAAVRKSEVAGSAAT